MIYSKYIMLEQCGVCVCVCVCVWCLVREWCALSVFSICLFVVFDVCGVLGVCGMRFL